ncbi:TAXI family TRAP transporter solute-binding subunit [Streptomonospora sp. PA3]|uniref:TAXI family TRAP transporter solute-binding subunit n=1 Tax=Streptomonospora sp. PA3 TaxID=2607326 RepID=UPI0012DC1C94|nr:TAXI family TRAP transporter solute-binding subunit [Streptomonospora sp. PA3]MUL40158.1 TAXI family TRAP transporter solute-binding subunit [Streptomonospora sp. PA3]
MRTGLRTGRLAGVTAAAAAGVIALAGCGVGDAGAGGELTMATGSTGGTYYPLGAELAKIWSDNIEGVNVSTQSSGASVENMRLLDQGENELIMAVNGVAASAVQGQADFKEEPLSNPGEVRMLGNVYPEVMQIVATQESGIETIEDLEGKRVDIGPPGSGTAVAAEQILEAYGMSLEDIEVFNSTFEDAASKLSDGQTDAAFAILALPAGSIEQVATTTDVRLVDITGDGLEQLTSDNPSYSPLTIEAGTYSGQEEPAETVTNWATLYTTADLGEDTAYNLVKEMYERAGKIGHDVGSQIKLETALEGQGPIELHPGARRYYEEEGVLG